jgi:hypothetical protein
VDYLRLKDFQTRELKGTTAGTADAQTLFRHTPPSAPQAPTFWCVLEGDVYVPRNGAGPELIDVRSRRASEAFRLLLFY